jgi:5-methylcytosine-specific restriction endonuclease McrA
VYRERNKAKLTEKDAAYYQSNRERLDAQNRAWAKANREARAEHQRRWKKRNVEKGKEYKYRRRARIRGASSVVPFSRESIFERDGWICQICYAPVHPGEESIDHIVHVSRGGPHTPENVRLAHRRCNTERGTRD